jgi:hypothetical protein
MNFKGFEMKRSWLNFKMLSWNSPGGTEENNKTLNQDRRTPGRDFKQGTPEYEKSVLTIRPRRSITNKKQLLERDMINRKYSRCAKVIQTTAQG